MARNIVHAPLDPRTVFRLPVSVDRVTTVYFPGRISGLESMFVTADGEPPARFQCTFLPGQRYFSVRAVQTNGAANINVVWNGGVFVFELVPSPEPVYALILSAPNRFDRSGLESTTSAPAAGPPEIPVTPGADPSTLRATNNSVDRRWPPASGGTLRESTASVRGQPVTTGGDIQEVPPDRVVTARALGVATNKVSLGISDKQEKKERWWSRWRIPYLIKITINPRDRDDRP